TLLFPALPIFGPTLPASFYKEKPPPSAFVAPKATEVARASAAIQIHLKFLDPQSLAPLPSPLDVSPASVDDEVDTYATLPLGIRFLHFALQPGGQPSSPCSAGSAAASQKLRSLSGKSPHR